MIFDKLTEVVFKVGGFNLAKPLLFCLIVISVLFPACQGEKKEEVLAGSERKADSTANDFNSKELKEVNAELLNTPNDPTLYVKRSRVYIGLKDFDLALSDALRATKLDSSKAEHYIALADVYFASNKARYAKETLEYVVKRFPDNSEGLLKLAELLYLVRQYESAIAYINKALKLDESNAKAYYLKGSIYKESGDTAKAISSIQTAVEQDNQYFDAYNDLGLLYGARKNPLAFQYFDNALRINPSSQVVLYNKAKLLQDMKRIDESMAVYDQILQINRDNTQALYNIGAIFLAVKKDPRSAIEYFSKAITVDPKFTEAYFARGVSFEELKDFSSAKADYKAALDITPNYEPAVEALNNLEKK
jgi:tetratricopeptide (TPR) repeat protein